MRSFAVFVLTAALRALYQAFRLAGVKDHQIVCISRQSDSAPIDFCLLDDYFKKQCPEIQVVILAKTLQGALPYALHVIKQLYYIATSRAIVLDSYCVAVSLLGGHIKAPVVQLWHALGNMKKFGYSALNQPEGRSVETAKLLNMHRGYDSLLISSKNFIDDYAEGFGVNPSIITELPLPRVDLLISDHYKQQMRDRIIAKYPELAQKKNVVYCPTFRKTPAQNEHEAISLLLAAIDFNRYNFVFSPHPVSTQSIDDSRVIRDNDPSLNMLYIADFVISDYSTVIYEVGLLGVPTYLYAYDWDTYSQKRSLNIDIAQDVPTLFTDDPKRIMAAIENNDFDHDAYRSFLENNVTLPTSGTCTQHVAEHILSLMENCRDEGKTFRS